MRGWHFRILCTYYIPSPAIGTARPLGLDTLAGVGRGAGRLLADRQRKKQPTSFGENEVGWDLTRVPDIEIIAACGSRGPQPSPHLVPSSPVDLASLPPLCLFCCIDWFDLR